MTQATRDNKFKCDGEPTCTNAPTQLLTKPCAAATPDGGPLRRRIDARQLTVRRGANGGPDLTPILALLRPVRRLAIHA